MGDAFLAIWVIPYTYREVVTHIKKKTEIEGQKNTCFSTHFRAPTVGARRGGQKQCHISDLISDPNESTQNQTIT